MNDRLKRKKQLELWNEAMDKYVEWLIAESRHEPGFAMWNGDGKVTEVVKPFYKWWDGDDDPTGFDGPTGAN